MSFLNTGGFITTGATPPSISLLPAETEGHGANARGVEEEEVENGVVVILVEEHAGQVQVGDEGPSI